MKRFTTLAIFIALVTITFAQTHMYVWENGAKTNYIISEVDSITFGDEETPKKIIGVFSVSEDKQVVFSKGNLQYCPKTSEWRFAEKQFDYLGELNWWIANPNYSGWIDLFGWGTGINPTETLYGNKLFYDWGINPIGNDTANTWRTLSEDEWEYILWRRTNANNLYGIAQVNGVNGLILLPDNWKCPDDITFKSGFDRSHSSLKQYYAEYQSIDINQWSILEFAGAVFLPAAGERYGSGNEITSVQNVGCYWNNTRISDDRASLIYFTSQEESSLTSSKYSGYSVRLVKDVVTE